MYLYYASIPHWAENRRNQEIPAHKRERGGVAERHLLFLEARIAGRDALSANISRDHVHARAGDFIGTHVCWHYNRKFRIRRSLNRSLQFFLTVTCAVAPLGTSSVTVFKVATLPILNGSSTITRPITTNTAVTPGWAVLRRLNGVAYPHSQSPNLNHLPGGYIATAYFRPQPPPELEFDTDTQARWVSDDDVRKQNQFIDKLFDLAA
jgi:hypothetical protein